jgi:Transposase IS116/IS110/IS902 family
VPSVGPLVAITYKSAMDDPSRIAKSKAAGALFGLTPKKYQSGEKDVTGGITRTGDEMVRIIFSNDNVELRCSAWEALLHSVSLPRVLRSGPPQGAGRTAGDDRSRGPDRWP